MSALSATRGRPGAHWDYSQNTMGDEKEENKGRGQEEFPRVARHVA